jgi:hypothetical protein
MSEVKYRNDSKAVLVEIDMVHGQINEVMIFETKRVAKLYCYAKHKIDLQQWSGDALTAHCYIDETRRLEIQYAKEVIEF